jgi:hypothetical protein
MKEALPSLVKTRLVRLGPTLLKKAPIRQHSAPSMDSKIGLRPWLYDEFRQEILTTMGEELAMMHSNQENTKS